MFRQLRILVVTICALSAPTIPAEDVSKSPPKVEPTERVARLIRNADDAYEAGEYRRAFLLYRDDVAPTGDKFSQYRVGWMYFHGEGVDKDPALGAAWLALAAEREHPALSQAHAEAVATLPAAELARVETLTRELQARMGDCMLQRQAQARDEASYGEMTGSRVGATRTGAVTVMNAYGTQADNQFVVTRRAEDRMSRRAAFLEAHCSGDN